jgi:hypothetical protein
MKEQIKGQIGQCSRCGDKYQPLDDSGHCESCFDDPTESEPAIMQYEAHPFQPMEKAHG